MVTIRSLSAFTVVLALHTLAHAEPPTLSTDTSEGKARIMQMLRDANKSQAIYSKIALGKIVPDKEISEYLLTQLPLKESYAVKRQIIVALGKDKTINLRTKITAFMTELDKAANETDYYFIQEGQSKSDNAGLAIHGIFEALDDLGAQVVPYLREFRNNAHGHAKTALLLYSGKLGDKDVFEDMVSVIEKSNVVSFRINAARSLGIIGDQRAIPYLLKALKDASWSKVGGCVTPTSEGYYPVRESACAALNTLGKKCEIENGEYILK